MFEGEEEAGSANLQRVLAANKAAFAADIWPCATGRSTRRAASHRLGARDVVTFNLTLYGPTSELHSGHYGNWAPNPAMELSQLLASMKDREGRS